MTMLDKNQDELSLEFHEIIRYVESNPETTLTISKRLDFYLRAMQVTTEYMQSALFQIAVGYDIDKKSILKKAAQVETAIFYSCIMCEYSFVYSQSAAKVFHDTRLIVVEYFIKNYKEFDRFELFNKLFQANKEKQFLKVLSENNRVILNPDIIFKALSHALLSQLYILVDDDCSAISSLMNASFFYGANIQSSEPIALERMQEIISHDAAQRARAANEGRWQGHVEQLRRKYLELDTSRHDKKTGKKPTIKAVSQWIYEHHNENDLELETIRDHVSKARQGIFTNTKK